MVICSFCQKEFDQDLTNFGLRVERQDFPGKTQWQKSYDLWYENSCPTCYNTIFNIFKHITENFRKNKGKFIPNK